MRSHILIGLALVMTSAGCGGDATPPDAASTAPAHAGMPSDDVHEGLTGGMAAGHAPSTVNRTVALAPDIATAWAGVTIRLADRSAGSEQVFEVPIGAPTPLGDSGLTLTVEAFVPDFVMDEGGITSRSDQPNNPAARISVQETGLEPFHGWLFAAMPEIHPFPHDRFMLLLDGGVPAPPVVDEPVDAGESTDPVPPAAE